MISKESNYILADLLTQNLTTITFFNYRYLSVPRFFLIAFDDADSKKKKSRVTEVKVREKGKRQPNRQ